MQAGYVQNSVHAPSLPVNTVLRASDGNSQYYWDGAKLHSIGDTPTSECLLVAYPQNGVAVVPPSWLAGQPQGSTEQCSLADGTRFTETDTGTQQYISLRGAAFPLSYSDAVAYDGESDAYGGLVMQAGYVQNAIHAAVMPVSTVLRTAGGNAQYFWDGTQLHYVADGATSQCLLSHYPQSGVAVTPGSWVSAEPIGANATCS